MGYSTDFTGRFELNKPLTEEHAAYLNAFAATRRFKRNPDKLTDAPDPIREAVNLPLGTDGCYFVGEAENCGQNDIYGSALDYNYPPYDQPSLWCQWVPTEDRTAIIWDGNEKFYEYDKWIEYLIEHFLKPWGYELNGEVAWQGVESDDRGVIHIKGNQVEAIRDKIHSPRPSWG